MNLLLDGQETERLKFRRILLSDFNDWLKFFEDPAAHQHWTQETVSPLKACNSWYARQIQRYENEEGGMNALVLKSTGDLIGHCGLLKQTVDGIPEVEIAYSLLPKSWSKGYAAEAAMKCRDFAFAKKLSPSLISIISVTNKPSEAVALKVGMKVEKVTDYKGNRVSIFRISDTSFNQ